jgi:hypothetical protein
VICDLGAGFGEEGVEEVTHCTYTLPCGLQVWAHITGKVLLLGQKKSVSLLQVSVKNHRCNYLERPKMEFVVVLTVKLARLKGISEPLLGSE